MRRIMMIGFIFSLLTAASLSANELEWQDFNAALEKASEENKPVLVDFYTDWCHWCKVMDSKTFGNEEVAGILSSDFTIARVHAEDSSKEITYRGQSFNNVQFTRAMGISGFPSIAFFNNNGEAITVVPGFIEADVFKHILAYVRDGCYKRQMSFKEFMDRHGNCDAEGETKTTSP